MMTFIFVLFQLRSWSGIEQNYFAMAARCLLLHHAKYFTLRVQISLIVRISVWVLFTLGSGSCSRKGLGLVHVRVSQLNRIKLYCCFQS